ncbi:hypothetical protein Bbelb_021820 [Branchiostoma belcheri]|nr:hypothetical protein Bbelb_021820 [Branchiostoma belcheri]
MLIGTHAPLRSVTIDENKLKVAENFTYLGSSINNKGQMDNELDCRLGKASAAFNQLGFETYYVEISQEKRLESLDASDSECNTLKGFATDFTDAPSPVLDPKPYLLGLLL